MKQNVIQEASNIFKLLSSSQNIATDIINLVPTGISIATDISCKEIRHNQRAAEFLRIKPWENLSYTDSENQPAKIFHKGKELSHTEMPLQRSGWQGVEIKDLELEFIWDDGVHKTSVWNSIPLRDDRGTIIGAVATFEDITDQRLTERDLLKAEEQIKLDSKRLEEILETIPSSVILVEAADGQFSYVNRRGRGLYGFDYVGFDLEAHIDKVNALKLDGTPYPLEDMPVSHSLKFGKEVRNKEMIIERADGLRIPIVVSSSPLYDAQGNITAAIVIFEDITERKKMEEIEAFQAKVLSCANEAIHVHDENYLVTYWNESAEKLYGWTAEEAYGRFTKELFKTAIFPDSTREEAIDNMLKDDCWQGEVIYHHKDGKPIYVEAHTKVLRDEHGGFKGSITSSRDITERKQAEAKIQHQEAVLKGINRIFHEALTCETEEELEMTCLNVAQEMTQSRFGFLGEINAAGDLDDIAVSDLGWAACRTPPPLHSFLSSPLLQNGEIIGMVGLGNKEGGYSSEDVETLEALSKAMVQVLMRKRADEMLKRDKQQLEKLVQERTRELNELNQRLVQTIESVGDCFFTLDPEWRVTYWNKAAEKMFRIRRKDILGKNFWEVFPRSIGSEFYKQSHLAISENRPVYFETLGVFTGRWLAARAYPSKLGLTIYANDINERKQAQEALRQSEERFNKLYNANPFPMFISSVKDGTCLDVNDSFIKASGYSREEIIGFRAIDVGHWVNKEERYRLMEEIKRKSYANNFEVSFRAKTGEVRFCLLSCIKINLHGEEYILTIANDITELRSYQNEIARLDRLNLVGEMAAGIGHEVRNPMTTIKGFLQLLGEKDRYAQDREYFELMVDELDRANSIITEFLSLAKNKAVDLEMRNLNKILKNLLPLIEADGLVTDKYIKLETQKITDLLLDEKEIRQMILNLVRNGMEAMSPGGVIKIRTYSDEDEVGLSVQDTGKGIEPEVLQKIGTPFFTTKDTGTGLGLAICYSIAARHNARVDVETGPEGTTFFVRFKRPG